MSFSHSFVIERLGGVTAVAKRLKIKAPSVSGWIEGGRNGIPDGRLLELAAAIEKATDGDVCRRKIRPDDYWEIWPDMAPAAAPAHADELAEQGVS